MITPLSSMMARIVLLYNSKVRPWRADLTAIQQSIAVLVERGAKCEVKDTAQMPDEEMVYWRGQVMSCAMWQGVAVRQVFGSNSLGMLPYLSKEVPALLVYQSGKGIPVAVYPHRRRRGRMSRDYSITNIVC
jgi:hypothetical protein